MDELMQFQIDSFRQQLIDWFYAHQRELPWRKTNDPYHIWVSEVMLQQTRVDTVIPYYKHFIRKFPTLQSLATAEEDDVLKAWEGLGYYSRARHLQKAAQQVVQIYDGHIPRNRQQLLELAGIGPYTAGAILSIAFNKPEPAVDGNVMRVISRLLHIEEDITKAATKKKFENVLTKLIAPDDPSAFNQGLMELGALVCSKTSPGCLLCPVQMHCKAYALGVQEQLPKRAKRKKQVQKQIASIIIQNDSEQWFIERRPARGLLANLWQFPTIEIEANKSEIAYIRQVLAKKYNIFAPIHKTGKSFTHIFTHLVWNITLYEVTVGGVPVKEAERQRWVKTEDLEQYTFPVPHQKMISYLLKRK